MSTSSMDRLKSRKNSKDREKRKSQTGSTEPNSNDKGHSSKDSRQYAGIGPESICLYAEQSSYEHLSDEICNTLAEDINYKLRYIIHEALLKSRLCGRDVIVSQDIDETFENLSIEKVYGAPSSLNWVPSGDVGDQNFLYLNDTEINMIELAEAENTYAQHGHVMLTKKWFPDPDLLEPSQALRNYFITVCETVISNDEELRWMALKDISENPRIGPITDWFYNFGYLLLMKDITYDSFTLCALDLIETLENSPLSSSTVSVKLLKLLVRLLLQRLLLSSTSRAILRKMCFTLAVLCLRIPLKEMTIAKINQKLDGLPQDKILAVVMTIYFLGSEAIEKIFIPNVVYFLKILGTEHDFEMIYIILAIYAVICKMEYNNNLIECCFHEVFENELVMYWKPMTFEVPEPLTILLNHCICNGEFPDEFELTKVIPIFKKGDKNTIDNYCPILIIPIFGKIFEIILQSCLILFFIMDKTLLRQNCSAVQAIQRLMADIIEDFEAESEKMEVDFISMKTQLLKTRRKVDCTIALGLVRPSLEDVFELPSADCSVKRKINEHRLGLKNFKKETHVIVGKTSLLLSVLNKRKNKVLPKCNGHSLLCYNL